MSIAALKWAWEICGSPEIKLSASAKLVLLRLADHADGQDVARPRHRTMAADLGLNRDTVIKSIAVLEDLGTVVVLHAPGRTRANRYVLNLAHDGSADGGADFKAATGEIRAKLMADLEAQVYGSKRAREREMQKVVKSDHLEERKRSYFPAQKVVKSDTLKRNPHKNPQLTIEAICKDGKWDLDEQTWTDLVNAFSADQSIDWLIAEIRKAIRYNNYQEPANRKTRRGMRKFLLNWCNRALGQQPRSKPGIREADANQRARLLAQLNGGSK